MVFLIWLFMQSFEILVKLGIYGCLEYFFIQRMVFLFIRMRRIKLGYTLMQARDWQCRKYWHAAVIGKMHIHLCF